MTDIDTGTGTKPGHKPRYQFCPHNYSGNVIIGANDITHILGMAGETIHYVRVLPCMSTD